MVTTADKLRRIRDADPDLYAALILIINTMLASDREAEQIPANKKSRRR